MVKKRSRKPRIVPRPLRHLHPASVFFELSAMVPENEMKAKVRRLWPDDGDTSCELEWSQKKDAVNHVEKGHEHADGATDSSGRKRRRR